MNTEIVISSTPKRKRERRTPQPELDKSLWKNLPRNIFTEHIWKFLVRGRDFFIPRYGSTIQFCGETYVERIVDNRIAFCRFIDLSTLPETPKPVRKVKRPLGGKAPN